MALLFGKSAAISTFMKRFQWNSGVKLLFGRLFEWRGLFLRFPTGNGSQLILTIIDGVALVFIER